MERDFNVEVAMVILEKEKIEYQEAHALYRHYHNLQWVSGTIFISMAFGILGLTWEVRNPIALLFFMTVSLVLYFLWFAIQIRYQDFAETARDRIWKLEEQMGLNLHLQIKEEDEERKSKKPIRYTLKRMHYMTRYIIPLSLGILWVLRILFSIPWLNIVP